MKAHARFDVFIGAFDLSVGAVLGLAAVLVTWLQARFGVPPGLAILATIGVGAAVGTVNGLLVTKLRVNSFIATLAMASILQALIYGVSGGNNIIGGNSRGFLRFASQALRYSRHHLLHAGDRRNRVVQQTPIGRFLYAVGSNPEAARLSGIRTARYLFGSLVASSVLASVAGILFAAKVGSASLTASPPYLLPAFAAVLLGTTQIRPGRPNVAGTVLAIFLVAVGSTGLNLMGVPIWVSDLFDGTILIVAVALAQLRGSSSAHTR